MPTSENPAPDPRGGGDPPRPLSTPSTFGIGALAGLCFVLVPPALAMLNAPERASPLMHHPVLYPFAALLAALVFGTITVLLQRRPDSSRATLMTAFGVPALLTSAMNTSLPTAQASAAAAEINRLNGTLVALRSDTAELRRQSDENARRMEQLVADVSAVARIPRLPPTRIYVRVPAASRGGGPRSWRFDPRGLAGASVTLAVAKTEPPDESAPSPAPEAQLFVVVIGRGNTLEQAEEQVDALRAEVPDAQVALIESGYVVVSGPPRPEPEALVHALRLRQEHPDLQPELLPVPAQSRAARPD